jgi:hypothetical protein
MVVVSEGARRGPGGKLDGALKVGGSAPVPTTGEAVAMRSIFGRDVNASYPRRENGFIVARATGLGLRDPDPGPQHPARGQFDVGLREVVCMV